MAKDYVELGPTGLAIRIFRSKKAAALYCTNPSRGLAPEPVIRQMEHAQAVGEIRLQVFQRDDYTCVVCGCPVVWERDRPNSGEMDERQARGSCQKDRDGHYHSGEVSVDNCQTLCKKCHTGPGGKQDRSPSFTKSYGQSPVRAAQAAVNAANGLLSFAEQYRIHRGDDETL